MATTAGAATPALDPGTVDAYLARIGHGPVSSPTVEALASLQDAHVRTVPFENLDIHLGRPLSLEVHDLAAKVVEQRRGGFCFELNGLFRALLASLGYTTQLVEARPPGEAAGEPGPRFDHARILVATDEGMLLVDVGSGASPRGPIRLHERPQRVGHEWYRVRAGGEVPAGGHRYHSDRLEGEAWEHDWTFDTAPRCLTDFADRCRFHQHSPESHFTRKPVCTLVTTDGRLTLADRRLITTRRGRRREEEVADPLAVLAERFGITLERWPGS